MTPYPLATSYSSSASSQGLAWARRTPAPLRLFLMAALLAASPFACAENPPNSPRDGYYTAEAAQFDDSGWKEFLTIHVRDGLIISAKYDSRNASGFPRSWDMADMRSSSLNYGSYQNRYARAFADELLDRQIPAEISPPPGTARAFENFRLLAEAALAKARAGDRHIAFVPLSGRDASE